MLKRIEELEEKLAQVDVSTDSTGALVNALNAIVQQRKNQQHNSGEIISLVSSQNLIREFNGKEGPNKANVWI